MSRTNSDESKLALIKEHETTFELVMAKYKVKKFLEEDAYDSMVMALLETFNIYGEERYKSFLLDNLCSAVEECIKAMSYESKVIIGGDPYYSLAYDELDDICNNYTKIVASQKERADRITAAVNQLVTV